jgi:CMP-N,N'-diacetyllegionaminic acid synthase
MSWDGHRVLALVPARSGSKGIPDKNIQMLGDRSLIAWTGDALANAAFVDARVISTDSEAYAEEGRIHGLDAPFLRPQELSGDAAGIVETAQHAVTEVEQRSGTRFDVILIVEPTSPFREARDLQACTSLLVTSRADSVITVSPLDEKFHPLKVLTMQHQTIGYFDSRGGRIIRRQQLDPLYFRNGICYAVSRECLFGKSRIIAEQTLGLVIDRPVVNIDSPLDLEWARFLLRRRQTSGRDEQVLQ